MRPGLTVLALGTLLLALPAAAQEPAKQHPPTLSLTGQGIVQAAPDLATLTIAVVTDARTARDAVSANSAAMDKVRATLAGLKIAPRDLATSGFSVQPRYSSGRNGENLAINGFQARNGLRVKVRDVSQLGPVLDAVISDGANQVSGLSFELADPAPRLDEARTKAVEDARRKAELYAKAAGMTLGRLVSITEQGAGLPPPIPMYRAEAMAARAAPVPIEPGEQDIRASVTATWELSPR